MNTQLGEPNANHQADVNQQADVFVSSVILTAEQNTTTVLRSSSEEPALHSKGGYRVVMRAPADLHHYPAFVKHGLRQSLIWSPKTTQSWDPSELELIFITSNNILLKGDETVQFALQNGVEQLSCLEYDYTEDEALFWMLKQFRITQHLNPFLRIRLALELEPLLLERARENQSIGGRLKGSANLTEDRVIDCRREIAAAAGVCDANVRKVKKLIQVQDQEVLTWLHAREVSIDRAFRWLKNPKERVEYLEKQSERAIKCKIRRLLKRHPRRRGNMPDVQRFGRKLAAMSPAQINSTRLIELPYREFIVCISEGLLQALESQEALLP